MTFRFLPLLALAGTLGACASLPHGRSNPVVEAGALASAAEQVRRCYRSPRIPSHGREIVTHVRVNYAGGGTIVGVPILLRQEGVTPGNRGYAAPMAEAAIASVLRCSPITLPAPMRADPWQIDYRFSLAAAV